MCRRKMSISFNRNNSQVLYESFIDVSSVEELWIKKDDFKNHVLTPKEANQLKHALENDAIDFFYNGIVSFSEGIDNAYKKHFSWATVKLYYSIYYLIRASLAVKGIALLRCKSMFRLPAKSGEKPFASTGKRYNTTHEGTINHYRDLYGKSDKLLANNIEDKDVYQWMMEAREIVNYRSAAFSEPECLEIWEHYSKCIDEGEFIDELFRLEEDSYIMCFQEEFAILAIPIKRLQETIEDFSAAGLCLKLSEDRNVHIKKIIGQEEKELKILRDVL